MKKSFFDDALMTRGMSLRQLAKRMDVLPSQLSLTFNGKRRMQMAEAVRISQLLGVSLNEVIVAAGISEAAARRCKVIGILAGDGLVSDVESGTIERVAVPEGMPAEVAAVQARTSESALAWMDGWVFFINGEQVPSELLDRFCLVRLDDGRRVMATLRRGYTSGTFNLAGLTTIQNQRVVAASPVLITRH
ncbi:hypothetical protein D3C76_47590 [compost metagenome]